MQTVGLWRSLCFAVVAATAVVPWMLMARPWLGSWTSMVIYSAAITVLYLMVLASNPRRALQAAAMGLVLCGLGVGFGLAGGSPWAALLLCSLAMAGVRGGFLAEGRGLRTVLVEGALLLSGWGLVALLGSTTLLGLGFAFWGFFLAQCLFVLTPQARPPRHPKEQQDPFEAARDGALELMGEEA